MLLKTSLIFGLLAVSASAGAISSLPGEWTVVDANADGVTWEMVADKASVRWNSGMPMDDWLISPGIEVEGGFIYPVQLVVASESSAYPERVEVKYGVGQDAGAMSDTLIESTEISGGKKKPMLVKGCIRARDYGTLYLGIHGISPADGYGLHVLEITVGQPVSWLTPAGVEDFVVRSSDRGLRSADISFTAPTVDRMGNALGEIARIEVSRDGGLVKTFVNPEPGERLAFTDAPDREGIAEYRARAFNGLGAGEDVSASCVVGFAKPISPERVEMTSTMAGEVELTWSPVAEDHYGKPLPENEVKYDVYRLSGAGEIPVALGIADCRYGDSPTARGEQQLLTYAVVAKFRGRESERTLSEMKCVGVPYGGLYERGESCRYAWGYGVDGDALCAFAAEFTTGIPSEDCDGRMFHCKAAEIGACGQIISGLVDLAAMERPMLIFYTYNLHSVSAGADVNDIMVKLRTNGEGKYKEIFCATVDEICKGVKNDWGRAAIDLGEYAGQKVQVMFETKANVYANTLIDGIRIDDVHDCNLALTRLWAPAKVNAGSRYTIEAEIRNDGMQDAGGYTVGLYAGPDLVATRQLSGVEAGKPSIVKFEREFTPLDTEPVEYRAQVVWKEDRNAADDLSDTVTVSPTPSPAPAPAALMADADGRVVTLTWTRPDAVATPIGYNIYRDGSRINGEALSYPQYTDTEVADGRTYRYRVTALYDLLGESGGSDAAEVTVGYNSIEEIDTGITIATAQGAVEISAPEVLDVMLTRSDGIRVYEGKTTPTTVIRVAPGVYMLRAGTLETKILVK